MFRRAKASSAALAGLCVLAQPALSQSLDLGGGLGALGSLGGGALGGLRPNINTDTRVNDIRPQLESYFARNQRAPSITTPAWQITPSVSADIGATDNANRAATGRHADLFTVVSAGLAVSRDAPRFKLNLSYNPNYTRYLSTPTQNGFSQTGNARMLGIVVPDTVFIEARGSIAQQSRVGNGFSNQTANTTTDRQNQVTTYTYSISPYAQRRFGGYGTGTIGYSFSRSIQDTNGADNTAFTNNNAALLAALGTPGYGTTGNLNTHRERASFTSGENLGRFNDTSFVEAVQYSGAGSYRGAHRNEAQNELGFALTRKITLLGGIGYQDLFYNGVPAYRISQGTWNVGGRYTPNQDSTLTLLYGRRDGSTSFSFDGQFAPTAQTRLFGRYSTGVTSDVEEAQNLLASTSVGATGQVSDGQSGAPVGSSGFSGIQNGIYRSRRLSVSGILLRQRDSYTVGLSTEERTTLTSSTSLLTNTAVPAGTSTTSTSVNVGWQHDLSPSSTTSLQGQYGVSNNTSQLTGATSAASATKQKTLSVSAAYNKQFTQTLSATFRYTYTDQSGGVNGTFFNPATGRSVNTGSFTENLLVVGLRKSF